MKRKIFICFFITILCILLFLPYQTIGLSDWKAEANERIENIRKRNLQIQLVDPRNNLLVGYRVQLRQLRHHFAFGTAVNRDLKYNTRYADYFKEHFEWAVCENEAKWYHNEPWPNQITYEDADYIYNFCQANDITMRGHCVFWAVEQYVQNWVKQLGYYELQLAVDNRINSVVNHFKGKYVHWDVCNEILHGNFFSDRLGSEIYSYMFKRTKELDPQVKCYVNDYNTFEWYPGETDAYIEQIQNLIAQGAPVDGIGCQGHFNHIIDPELIYTKLSKLATLGLPILITEYDTVVSDEYKRADNLEKLYRIAFSHPAVEGVFMWGFWAGNTYQGADAAIVNLDWTLNEAGRRYEALLKEWTTNETATSNAAGICNFRAFHGKYEVIITNPQGETVLTTTVSLPPDLATLTLTYQIDDTTQPPSSPLISPSPSPIPHNELQLKMYNGNRTQSSNTIDPYFKINNFGNKNIKLSDLKIRYYYTNDQEKVQNFWSDHSMINTFSGEYRGINSSVYGRFVQLNPTKTTANCYLEIGFNANAGDFKPGDSMELQIRIANSDWSNYSQLNDYSFNPNATSLTDWEKVTVYENEELIWGSEP